MRAVSLVLASAILLGALPSNAAEISDFLGKWEGKGDGDGDVGATIRRGKSKPDWLVVDLEVGAPGCGGSMKAFGRLDSSGVLRAVSDDPNAGPDQCKVSLKLDSKKRLGIVEGQGCTYFHGFSCSFSSDLKRVR